MAEETVSSGESRIIVDKRSLSQKLAVGVTWVLPLSEEALYDKEKFLRRVHDTTITWDEFNYARRYIDAHSSWINVITHPFVRENYIQGGGVAIEIKKRTRQSPEWFRFNVISMHAPTYTPLAKFARKCGLPWVDTRDQS